MYKNKLRYNRVIRVSDLALFGDTALPCNSCYNPFFFKFYISVFLIKKSIHNTNTLQLIKFENQTP
jgi:hypothetical protein